MSIPRRRTLERQPAAYLLSERGDSFAASPGLRIRIGLDQHIAYVEKIVSQGGPTPEQYEAFDRWLSIVADELRTGRMSKRDLHVLREAFGEALSLKTNQGFSLHKPHGYTGDFEIIDRMYRRHVTDDPKLRRWDLFFHAQTSVNAVRNRKVYFIDLLHALVEHHEGSEEALPVLNVASGPARDVFEFFESNGHDPRVALDCIDADGCAIEYAQGLCRPFLDRVTFQEMNALRFVSERRYKLIWSAGLFDYFGDKGFRFLLERLLSMLDEDGELVIGNFSKRNPTRNYMELIGDWHLYYRDEEELLELARSCGVAAEDVRIGQEPECVNLFLHVKRGAEFLPV